jgi:hypothetical protein
VDQPRSLPNECIYSLRLQAPDAVASEGERPPLRGQLEQVMSGRRHAFDSGEHLLAWLALELARVASDERKKAG